MKNIFIIICLFFLSTSIFAQKKVVEDSISVSGVCNMCKTRIEKALDLKGIKMANWNVDTKKLFIAYRPNTISMEEIQQKIADVGHDTDLIKAADPVYADLPFCCLYRDPTTQCHDESSNEHK